MELEFTIDVRQSLAKGQGSLNSDEEHALSMRYHALKNACQISDLAALRMFDLILTGNIYSIKVRGNLRLSFKIKPGPDSAIVMITDLKRQGDDK